MGLEMKLRENFNVAGCNSEQSISLAIAKPTLTVDVERYQALLDDSDMTDAQKEEFLQALWLIVVSFVELGFGVHPLQEVCGKDAEIGSDSAKYAFDAVRSENSDDEENTNGLSP